MEITSKAELVLENKSALVEFYPEQQTIVCTVLSTFLPRTDFISLFNKIGDFVKSHTVKKMIFDKSALKVFDQSSMEWYHLEWKQSMLRYGLSVYRKILPKDQLFRKSVEFGRAKIVRENPQFELNAFDIQYCESVEEAMSK
jgi:hypothetical protein